MKKKIILAGIGIIIILFGIYLSTLKPIERQEIMFHARLADPKLYTNGLFTDSFDLEPGNYVLDFVLSGGSPQLFTIEIVGNDIMFKETFTLKGTRQGTEIAEYYTWDYLGEKNLTISSNQTLNITIDPHGNTLGPVSVYVIDLSKIN